MEIKSMEDAHALSEYQKIKQIERIETKLQRLSFMPVITYAALLLWYLWSVWADFSWTPMHIVMIAIAILSVDRANVQRIELLKQLFELRLAGSATGSEAGTNL